MKIKWALLIFIVACSLISITGVCAADDNATVGIISQEINLNDSEYVGDVDDSKSFDDLRREIENAPAGTVINLTNDYQLSNDTNPISILENNITLDGGVNKCVFDGNSSVISSVFNIEGDNVILKNIKFINFNLDDSYKIIEWFGNNGSMYNCYFINNAVFRGTIVEWSGTGGCIQNCNFENNSALNGGALYLYSRETIVKSSMFINNRAISKGGSIFISGRNVLVEGCTFENSIAAEGGTLYIQSNNEIIKDCTFENSYASGDGGAIYIIGDNNEINNGYFFNNTAEDGGAVYLSGYDNSLNYSFFGNNFALVYGGAIFALDSANLIIDGCEHSNNAAYYGGAIFSSGSVNLIVNGCKYHDNFAYYGGAAYIGDDGEFNNSQFQNNYALYGGGAAYAKGMINVENSFFNENSADEAGALMLEEDAEIIGSSFTNNIASSNGGAIQTSKNLIINNSNFKNNAASDGTNNIALIADSSVIVDNNTTSDYPLYLKSTKITLIKADNITYGDTLKVVANVTFMSEPMNNGTLANIVDGTSYLNNLTDGNAIFNIRNLKAGSHRGSLNFILNGYSKSTVEYEFTVSKRNAIITAKAGNFVINYAKIYRVAVKDTKGKPVSGKKVAFKLNGKLIGYAKTNSKGIATIKITSKILKTARAGTKKLIVKLSDSNFNCPAKTVKVKIYKEKTKLVAKKKTFKTSIKIKKFAVALKNSKGKAMKYVRLTLKVKGKTYVAKTNKRGIAIFKITKLTKKGIFNAVIKFNANKYYNSVAKKVKITVR